MDAPHRELNKGQKKAIDDFTNRYLRDNNGKTKTEALQEYNREVSKSKSPYVSRKSSFTVEDNVVAEKVRSNNGVVHRGEFVKSLKVGKTCEHYITLDEFNTYIAHKLRDQDDFDITYINNFEYTDMEEGVQNTPNDKRYGYLINISVKYRKDRALVSCNQVSLIQEGDTLRLEESAFDAYSILQFLSVGGEYEEEAGQTYEVNLNQVTPLVIFILTNLLGYNKEDVYPDYNTVLEIIQRRKACTKLDIDVATTKVFNRDGVMENLYNDIGLDADRVNEIKSQYLKYNEN